MSRQNCTRLVPRGRWASWLGYLFLWSGSHRRLWAGHIRRGWSWVQRQASGLRVRCQWRREFYSDFTDKSDDDAQSAGRGLPAAQASDGVRIGCECKTNHWRRVSPDSLENLIVCLRVMTKDQLKRYVIGELAAVGKKASSSSTSSNASSSARHIYIYIHTTLGTTVVLTCS